jgi:hypothetical protein
MDEKPLFIPLKAEYYDAFEAGVKVCEYRRYGPRWNEKTCRPGRHVVLSRGYGKGHRLYGTIHRILVGDPPDPAAWKACYGDDAGQCIAIRIVLSYPKHIAPAWAVTG